MKCPGPYKEILQIFMVDMQTDLNAMFATKNLMVPLVRCVTPCYVCTVCRVQVSHARPSPGQHPGCSHQGWRDGATSGSITRPPTAAFTAPPATHSHTDQLYTWLKPYLNLPCPISSYHHLLIVAGVCAGAAVRLPGQV